MSLSSELRLWGIAIKELWQEEQRNHPYLHWLIAAFVFVYLLVHQLLRWSEQPH
jgi:hypothetical protein